MPPYAYLLVVSSHGLSMVYEHGDRFLFSFSYDLPILSDLDSTLMTLSNFNEFLKALFPNIVILGVRVSTYEFGEGGPPESVTLMASQAESRHAFAHTVLSST